MTISMSPRPILSPSCSITSFESHPGVFLVLDGARARWAFVSPAGLEILGLCDGTLTPQQISLALAEKHSIPATEALDTTETFLAAIGRTGLVYDHQETPSEIETPQTHFKGLTIEITKMCNLRCRHCYLAAGEQAANELGFNEIKHAISAAQQLGATFVNVSGGEPLLRKDCVALLEHIDSSGLRCILGTNGTLISAGLATRLAELPVLIQLSLDGATSATHDGVRGKGMFVRTMQGLEHLLEAGLAGRVVLAFTAMACNVHEATALMDLALEKGIKAVIFSSLLAGGNAKSNWQDLSLSTEQALHLCELTATKARELAGRLAVFHKGFSLSLGKPGVSKTLCSIGTNLRIDPEGNVYPCQCFVGGEDYKLGNIREQPLEVMVLGSRLQQIKTLRRERIELIEECSECPWRHFCGAGCMGHAYHMDGTVLSVPDCELAKRWTERLFELSLTHCLAQTPAQEPEWL